MPWRAARAGPCRDRARRGSRGAGRTRRPGRRAEWPRPRRSSPASRTNRATSRRRRASAPTTVSASTITRSIVSRLPCQDPQGLVRLAQAGMGAAQHLAQVARPAGQARAELADDEAEAVRVRAPDDVVDQVERDRRARLRERDPPPVRDPLRRRPGLAVHEVLADERLGPDLAVRVAPEIGEAGLRDLGRHDRVLRGPALTRRSPVVPALTPATLKSPPSESPKALSKAIS